MGVVAQRFGDLLADPSVAHTFVSGAVPCVLLRALPSVGRYVRVQLAGTDYLTLAEVEVYGRRADNRAPSLFVPALVTRLDFPSAMSLSSGAGKSAPLKTTVPLVRARNEFVRAGGMYCEPTADVRSVKP